MANFCLFIKPKEKEAGREQGMKKFNFNLVPVPTFFLSFI
jgi:hypothetical protein